MENLLVSCGFNSYRASDSDMMTSSNGNICAGNSPVPVNSPHKGQWRGALMFSLICVWINGWVNNREAGDFRRHLGHYDVIVMEWCVKGFAVTTLSQVRYLMRGINGEKLGLKYLNVGKNNKYIVCEDMQIVPIRQTKSCRYHFSFANASGFSSLLSNIITGDPLHSRAACTQPCNVNTHSRAHCSPGARLCEQWVHGCVNNGARLCASARLCRGSPVIIPFHTCGIVRFVLFFSAKESPMHR